jgi:hypothetical protein
MPVVLPLIAAAGRLSLDHNVGTMRAAHNPRQWRVALRPQLSGRRRSGCRWRRERRSGRGGGRRFRLRFFRPHRLAGCLRRRAGRLEFAYHRIGIDRCRCGGGEIARNIDHLDRHRQRLESVQRVGHGKILAGHGNRTGRPAARSKRGLGIGPRGDGIDLDGNGWRRLLERERSQRISGERRTAGQTEPRYGTHDDTTHNLPVTCCGYLPQPQYDHRSARTATQPCGPESLIVG